MKRVLLVLAPTLLFVFGTQIAEGAVVFLMPVYPSGGFPVSLPTQGEVSCFG